MARLTTNQLATLKASIAANANTVNVGGTDFAINDPNLGLPGDTPAQLVAAWYNGAATPAFKVYRTAVPMSEIMLNGFDWTRVDNLSVGKARIWEWMVNADPVNQTINPSKTNIRAGINAVWVGTQADLAVRAAVYLHCFTDILRGAKLFSTGAGTVADANGDGPATPGTDANGVSIVTLDAQDIKDAFNS